MRLDLRPNSVSDIVKFQSCSQASLDSSEFTNAHSALSEGKCRDAVIKETGCTHHLASKVHKIITGQF